MILKIIFAVFLLSNAVYAKKCPYTGCTWQTMDCDSGRLMRDGNGCEICECAPEICPLIGCTWQTMDCESEKLKRDGSGCEICECAPENPCGEGYTGCRTVNIKALNDSVNDIISDDDKLPGGKFEMEFDAGSIGDIVIKIDNILISMGAETVKINWAEAGGQVNKAQMDIDRFNANFSINLFLGLKSTYSFWGMSRTRTRELYNGTLSLKLREADMTLDMEEDNNKLSVDYCHSSIDELQLTSRRVKKGSRILAMMMGGMFKGMIEDMIADAGGDFQLPQSLINVFVDIMAETGLVMNIPFDVCDMIGSIFELMNGFSEKEGDFDLLTDLVEGVKTNKFMN